MLSAKEYFSLPQFSFHVAIGACQTKHADETPASVKASQQLVGLTLVIDKENFSVLAPTLDEKFIQGEQYVLGKRQNPSKQ